MAKTLFIEALSKFFAYMYLCYTLTSCTR